MALPDGIHNYLEEVRRRRRLVHLFGDSAMFVAASATALLLVVLMSGWLDRWRVSLRMGGAALLGVALLAFIVRLIVRLRRLRDPGHLAELVGAARPKLRSDLLSTVELSLQEGPTRFSAQLLGALASSTENALRRAAPATLVPARQMRPGAVALAATLIAWAAAATLAPSFLGKAAAGLFRVAGAAPDRVAAQPLLGDIVLRYVYPPHIGRIPRVVESSTGHISAPAGTRVELRTTALAPLRTATLVLERTATRDGDGDTGGNGGSGSGSGGSGGSGSGSPDEPSDGPLRVALSVSKGRDVRGAFVVRNDGTYHFQVEALDSRRLRDPVNHRVQIEPDARPSATMHSPPAGIEVTARQRMELGYVASDDFGLTRVDLVYVVGNHPAKRRELWHRPKGTRPRRATAKIEWDLAEVRLGPGARVTYWIEAVDNDTVSGPKVGASSSSTFKVFSPEERHQQVLALQQRVVELSLHSLSGRLLLFAEQTDSPPPGAQFDKVRDAHRADARLLDSVRALASRMRGDKLVSRTVLREIAGIDKRLGELSRAEAKSLRELAPARQKRSLKARAMLRLRKANGTHVRELERDALLLANLLDEQRLQNLVILSRQLAAAKKRLKELLARYRKTKSEALRKEILREIEYMKRKLQTLLRRMAKLRRSIPDEYLNAEALAQTGLDQELSKLQKLLSQKDARGVDAALRALEKKLDALTGLLENNLSGYRSKRLSKRERAFAEMMDRLRGMEAEQRELARRTRRVVRNYQRRASKLMQDKIAPFIRRELKKLEKLRKKLQEIERRKLASYQQEQLDRIRKRAQGLRRMLDQRDLEQALNMAQRTENALKALKDDIAEDVEGRYSFRRARLRRSLKRTKRAQALAAELTRDLEAIFPEPSSMLQPQDRQELSRLRQRQKSLQRAVEKLLRKLGKQGKGGKSGKSGKAKGDDGALPVPLGGKRLPRGLRETQSMMDRAQRKLGAVRPQEAQSQQEAAADQLRRMQGDLKRARQPRMASGRTQRERVKIPGADQFRPPKEFRQDILDAMKEKPPSRYRGQVKRYYRELVR